VTRCGYFADNCVWNFLVNEILIEAVFATDPDTMCIQVIDEYTTSINLGSFPAGETFTVWVNGVQVAEFTA